MIVTGMETLHMRERVTDPGHAIWRAGIPPERLKEFIGFMRKTTVLVHPLFMDMGPGARNHGTAMKLNENQ